MASDALDDLCGVLYGRAPLCRDYLGGSDAQMLTDAASEITTLREQLAEAKAEIARRDEFSGCDGCSTGDCPHGSVQQCADAMSKIIQEQSSHIAQLEKNCLQMNDLHTKSAAERDELRKVVAKLPKTADGVPVVPGMVLWGWIERYDGTPGAVHQQNWMTAKAEEIAKCYSTREAAEAARHGEEVGNG